MVSKKKNYWTPKNSNINKDFMLKILFSVFMILLILALKYGYIKNQYISFDLFKNYFSYDLEVYNQIENYAKSILKIKRTNQESKKISSTNVSSATMLYPADGIIEKSNNGGYFILISKPTDIIAPCDGTIIDVRTKAKKFDLLIQDNLKRTYLIENIDTLNVKKTDKVSMGKILGQKRPFELTEKDYIYFEQINSST